MATINAAQVKDLREKTGVGMMDCKKALTECDGDFVVWSNSGEKVWGGLFDKHWNVEIKTVSEY